MTVRNVRHLVVPVLGPDSEPILAGRLDGKRAFMRAIETLPPTHESVLVVLDFRGIELATSSYLSEAVIRLRDHVRLARSYLVVANLADKVAEELHDLLSRSNDALVACDLSLEGEPTNRQLLGTLEPALKETFDLVLSKGEANAVTLHNESSNERKIGPTAWNNRLNALSAKSLLVETAHGRTKTYRPLLEAA